MNLEREIDRYLRREDTVIARTLKKVCPSEGADYRQSDFKKKADAVMAAPILVAVSPVIAGLCVVVKLEDGGPVFYDQKRVGKDGDVNIRKIRCMVPNADQDEAVAYRKSVLKAGPHEDPRCTRIGSFMRQFELEELLQLWQVLKGEIALTDFRVVNSGALDRYRREWPESMTEKWTEAYFAGRPGLFSLWAMARRSKDDLLRYHADMLYAEKASLGLDLYIRYRTTIQMFKKLGGKFQDKGEMWKSTLEKRINSK